MAKNKYSNKKPRPKRPKRRRTRRNYKGGAETIKTIDDFCPLNDSEKISEVLKSFNKMEKPRSRKKSNIVVYFVYGMGCNQELKPEDIENIRKNFSKNWLKIKPNQLKIKCHKTTSALRAIMHTLTGTKPIAETSQFLQDLKAEMKADLAAGKRILAVGHSFGGAIIGRTAMELHNDPHVNNIEALKMMTFGSIFIPESESVSKINITHYLAIGDVAMRCNGKRQPKDFYETDQQYQIAFNSPDNDIEYIKIKDDTHDKNIKWIDFYNNDSDEPIYKKGILTEWQIHNSYMILQVSLLYDDIWTK
jgi:hypothetical protein